jgi:small subunit ribosomal protein S8
MNSKKAEKSEIKINRISGFLVELLQIIKEKGLIDFELNEENNKPSAIVKIKNLNVCKAIKPRYSVNVDRIEKYMRRYLPSKNFGTLVISTNKGLMTQEEAYKNNIGGSLIAYFY